MSVLDGGRVGDIRFQIMADGLFHALMYVVAAVGLWLLWRCRREFGQAGAGRLLIANTLIGFGMWHVLDGVVSHWLLGIHRIKMDSDMPLFWDLLWFLAFGVAFVLAGVAVRGGKGMGGLRGRATPVALSGLIAAAATGAALPPADSEDLPLVVVFLPGLSPAQAFEAVASIEGRLVWSDTSDQIWAIDVPPGTSGTALYARGAMLVSGTLVSQGCLNWIREQ